MTDISSSTRPAGVRGSCCRPIVAGLLGAALAAPAAAGGTGQLQFLGTSYLDVPAAFAASLEACRKVDPASVPALKASFEHWRATQAADQPRLQQLVLQALRQQGTPEQVDQLVAELKAAAAPGGPLVQNNFPTASLRPQDCERSIPDALSGKDLMINFHDYVAKWPAVASE